jgi:3-hydroxyisobutyrate dehydrogenase-like beta-hydroxyacid dehydrogenase
MKTIGFIGLGTMGAPMAANLLRKGYAVTVYNRTESKADELRRLGADVAPSPAEVARSSDVLFTIISDDAALQEVYYDHNGIIDGIHAGAVVFDCSTASPSLSRRLHSDLAEHYVEFLDAPVTGSKPGAINGTLVFMVGGNQEVLEEHQDILLAMGSKCLHMGPSGAGSEAKLAHNAIVGINNAAFLEGLAIAAKAGINLESFVELVQSGGASSRMAELKGKKVLDRDFSVQFSLNLMLKDLQLAQQLSKTMQLPTPLLQSAETLYRIGHGKGLGEQDLSVLAHCYEEWAQKEFTYAKEAAPDAVAAPEDNRRREIRIPLGIKLQISIYQWEKEGSFSGQSFDALLSDLSESGMQISCKVPLALEMFVVIHFPQEAELPPVTSKIIRIDTKEEAFHYGCLISGMPLYTRKKLENYIQQHIDSSR